MFLSFFSCFSFNRESILSSFKQDINAWRRGQSPSNLRLVNQSKSFFSPSPKFSTLSVWGPLWHGPSNLRVDEHEEKWSHDGLWESWTKYGRGCAGMYMVDVSMKNVSKSRCSYLSFCFSLSFSFLFLIQLFRFLRDHANWRWRINSIFLQPRY